MTYVGASFLHLKQLRHAFQSLKLGVSALKLAQNIVMLYKTKMYYDENPQCHHIFLNVNSDCLKFTDKL